MSKETILQKLGDLVWEIRGTVYPNPTDPENRIGQAPNSQEVQYLGPVVEDETLGKIRQSIQAAHTSQPDWERILGVLAGLIKIIPILFVVFLIGCSQNPPAIRDAHRIEFTAWQAYHENVNRQREALLADLREAFEVQTQLLEKYKLAMLPLQTSAVTPEQIEAVLKEIREKRAACETTLRAVQARWGELDANYYLAAQIHEDIGAYLERESDTSQSELNDAMLSAAEKLRNRNPSKR